MHGLDAPDAPRRRRWPSLPNGLPLQRRTTLPATPLRAHRWDVAQNAQTAAPLVLSPAAIAALPLEPLGTVDGVAHRVVWRDGTSTAGVLSVAAGRRLGTHAHRVNHHHMWVLEGRAEILGREVGPGSYVHIPSQVDHDIDATDSDGCTVLYFYVRPAD